MTQSDLNNFEGAEIQVGIYAPDINTLIEDPAVAVVGDGIEFDDDAPTPDTSFTAPVDINLTGGEPGDGTGRIAITIDQEQTSGSFFEADFSGYIFTDVNDELPAFENVTIDESVNALGLEADDITFSENTIEVNVEGLAYQPGFTSALNVDFADRSRDFDGSQIQVGIYAPDINTLIEDPAVAVVGDGIEFDDDAPTPDTSFTAPVDIDLTGDESGDSTGRIAITIDQEQAPGSFFEADFSGYIFTDVNDELPAFENVTIDESVNALGLEADDITFSENTIEVNVEGLAYQPGFTSALNVDFADEESESNFEPVFGSVDGDTIEVSGSNQLIFAGDMNDSVDATTGDGDNRIYAGSGDDTLILGNSDRAIAGAGDDAIFTTSGGDNTITGGEGADQFWIASAELPESANIITDFTSGEDAIGIAGMGIGFEDVSITATEGDALISATGSDLAILQGVDAASLTADDFAFA